MIAVQEKARGASAFYLAGQPAMNIPNVNGIVFSNPLRPAEDEWAKRIDELRQFRSLTYDWDGEGSPAPEADLVDGSISLAQSLRFRKVQPPDRVIVGVNGTVLFEWHGPQGYREIEVSSPMDAEDRWVPNDSTQVNVTLLRRST